MIQILSEDNPQEYELIQRKQLLRYSTPMNEEEIDKLVENHKYQTRKMTPQSDWKKQARKLERAAIMKHAAQDKKIDR